MLMGLYAVCNGNKGRHLDLVRGKIAVKLSDTTHTFMRWGRRRESQATDGASGTEYTYPMRCTALENAEGGFGGEPCQKNHHFMGP